MTARNLQDILTQFVNNSRYNIKYFTVNNSSPGVYEVISFQEEENGVGGTLPVMLPIVHPDTLVISELTQGLVPVQVKGMSYTYSVDVLGII